MAKLSRRDFIKLCAAGMGSLTLGPFLAACGQALSPAIPTTSIPNPPASPTDTSASPTDTPSPLPKQRLSLPLKLQPPSAFQTWS